MLGPGLEQVLQAQEPSPHTGYKKPTFFFNRSALVGLCYKTRLVGRPGECVCGGVRSVRRQHWGQCSTEPCGGWSSPAGRHQGRTDGGAKRSLGPYSLAMAKGFSTSILPQSAIVTSFRGLSRLSVLVLSTFRTTSWEGRQKQ